MIEPKVTWMPYEGSDDLGLEAYRAVNWADVVPPGVQVDRFDGWCPVQGEGTIDGRFWYFRARGEHWQFHVCKDRSHLFKNDIFYCDIEWPDEPFAAGWMHPVDALKCLSLGVALYRQQEPTP